jgi:hypothetical protein
LPHCIAAAGHKDGLVACGEKAVEYGWLRHAREEFAAAGEEMTRDRLVACGNKALEQGQLDAARGAFKEAAIVEQRGAIHNRFRASWVCRQTPYSSSPTIRPHSTRSNDLYLTPRP